ncbi:MULTISPECIES: toxin VasX [unclassified Gilliamella]|nr:MULTISPECIES: toxin VasX [unclassified Gilliamella]
MAKNGCGTCQRNGMPFFLVRQSVINPRIDTSKDWSEGVPQLTGRQPSAQLKQHKYALRMLRKGYVYVLMEKDGERKLLGYEVTSKGALRHRSIYYMKKHEIEDLAEQCTAINHYVPAIFANVDILNSTVWIAYSRRAWSKNVEDYYRSPEANLKRFTKVTVNDNTRKDPTLLTEGRSFAFSDLLNNNSAPYLPEFIFQKKDFDVRFPSAHEFYDYSHKDDLAAIKQVSETMEEKYQCKIGCIVLEDTFGIAEELNAQRLRNFDPINNAFLEHEQTIEKELADAFNEKIADFTPSDEWLTSPDKAQDLFPYAKGYFESIFTQNIDNDQSDTSQAQTTSVPLKPNEHDQKYIHEYFSRERAYKRRIVSCIESYKKGLRNYFNDTINQDYKGLNTQPRYSDVYEPGSNYQGAKTSYYQTIKTLQDNGYKEVALSITEKKELLEKHKSAVPVIDVRRFEWTLDYAAESKLNREWAKLEARLDLKKLDQFCKDDNQKFKEIIGDIRKISIDYLIYVTWLFGSKDKPSQYAPSELTDYNQVEFWKHEQENDYSKDHLGYMEDIITMLQGNISMANLPEQFGLWDSLFRDENSIYFYVLKGQDNNLYELLLKQRIDEMLQNQNDANKNNNVSNLNELVSKINSVMNLPIDSKNTTLFIDRMEELFSWKDAAFANRVHNSKLINQVLMKEHSIEQLKIYSGIEHRIMKVPVKFKNLPKVYEILMEHTDLSSVSIEKNSKLYNLSRVSDTDKRWQFESKMTKSQLEKTVNMEFMIVADDIASMDKMIHTLKRGGYLKEKTLAKTKNILGAEIKHAHQFSGELTIADLEAAVSQYRKRIRIDSTKSIALNALMIFLVGYLVSENMQTLNEQGNEMREEIKEQIRADIVKSCVIMSLLSTEVVAHTVKLIGALPKTNIFSTMIPSCDKFLKVTGRALSVITIYEGAKEMYKGYNYLKNGDNIDGILVTVGGLGILVSGSIYFLSTFLILSPHLFVAAIIISVIGAILVYIGSEAERWSPMEIWFNRCYFGKQQHREKGLPYSLTAFGTSMALNDYYAYLSGVYLALNYHSSDVGLFIEDIRSDYHENSVLMYAGGLHVHLKLPNFDAQSRYTCLVAVTDDSGQSGRVKILQGKDNQHLQVEVESNQCDHSQVRWVESKTYPIMSNATKHQTDLSTLVVDQKVAELKCKAKKVIGILHYWQGKDAKLPLIIEHIIN